MSKHLDNARREVRRLRARMADIQSELEGMGLEFDSGVPTGRVVLPDSSRPMLSDVLDAYWSSVVDQRGGSNEQS